MDNPNCPVCHSFSHFHVHNATVLHKYNASYYSCHNCGFLHASQPTWLDEAYGNDQAIVSADTGLLKRNSVVSQQMLPLLHFGLQLGSNANILDAAGGYGLLTRTLRDSGFNVYWDDKYCQNILAKGFAKSDSASKAYDVVTAFEVLEHVTNPLAFVQELLAESGAHTFVFSTELFAGRPPDLDWWYYTFPTGQHISFYQEHTLKYIADVLNLQFRTHAGLHIMTMHKLPPQWLYNLFVGRGWLRSLLAHIVKKQRVSLTVQDHKQMLSKGTK